MNMIKKSVTSHQMSTDIQRRTRQELLHGIIEALVDTRSLRLRLFRIKRGISRAMLVGYVFAAKSREHVSDTCSECDEQINERVRTAYMKRIREER